LASDKLRNTLLRSAARTPLRERQIYFFSLFNSKSTCFATAFSVSNTPFPVVATDSNSGTAFLGCKSL